MRGEDRPKRHSWRNESGVAERLMARQLQPTHPFPFHHYSHRRLRLSQGLSLALALELVTNIGATKNSPALTAYYASDLDRAATMSDNPNQRLQKLLCSHHDVLLR